MSEIFWNAVLAGFIGGFVQWLHYRRVMLIQQKLITAMGAHIKLLQAENQLWTDYAAKMESEAGLGEEDDEEYNGGYAEHELN